MSVILEPLALVTGASGLLGANLVLALREKGYRVRALIRDLAEFRLKSEFSAIDRLGAVDLVSGDIRDRDVRRVCLQGVDVVFHACHSHRYWESNSNTYSVNVRATFDLLNELTDPRVCFVFTTSRSTLEHDLVDYESIPDIETFSPRRFNSLTKYWSERALVSCATERGLSLVCLHLPYIVGPYDTKPTPLRLITPLALSVAIPLAPSGGCMVMGVREVVEEHIRAAEENRDTRSVIHLVPVGVNVTFREYIRIANKVAGHDLVPVVAPNEMLYTLAGGRIFDTWCAKRMIRHELAPGTSAQAENYLERTIGIAMEWFRGSSELSNLYELMRYAARFF